MDFHDFPLELKALSDTGRIEGLAAGYGNVDLGGDVIAPGALAASIVEHKSAGTMPALLLHHDVKRPAGVWESFTEAPQGLIAKGRILLDIADGRDAYALLRAKALTGLSIGYSDVKAKTTGIGTRLIEKAKLHEVSLVTVPMNPRTRVSSVKSLATVRDLEDLLRETGLSGRKAKAGASAAWRAILDQDDEAVAEVKLAELLTTASGRLDRFHGETK